MAFTNRDRLRRKMKAIPVGVRKALKTQNAQNAADMVKTAKGFAETSRLTGDLIDSIKHQDVSDSTQMSQRVSAGNKKAYYARFVEFGTSKNEPSPFFWPAYRLKKRSFKARMTRAAKKAIAEAVK